MSRYSQKKQMRRSFYLRRYVALMKEHAQIALPVLTGRLRLASAIHFEEPARSDEIAAVRALYDRYEEIVRQQKRIVKYFIRNDAERTKLIRKAVLA